MEKAELMKKQNERNKKYLNSNPEARIRSNISKYKSATKTFISKYSDEASLLELRELIDNKLKELK